MVFERCLNDWFGFPELYLEAACLHPFPPEVGQRREAGTLQVMHAQRQLQLRKIERQQPLSPVFRKEMKDMYLSSHSLLVGA